MSEQGIPWSDKQRVLDGKDTDEIKVDPFRFFRLETIFLLLV